MTFPNDYIPYEDRIADVLANGDKPIPTGMFLRYVMEKNNISQAALEKQMGLGEGELSSSLTGNLLQGDVSTKMAAITNMSESFWRQPRTNTALVNVVTIDTGIDAGSIKGKMRGDTEGRADKLADSAVLRAAGMHSTPFHGDRPHAISPEVIAKSRGGKAER